LIEAVFRGYTKIVKLLLQKRAYVNITVTSQEITPLWIAAEKGYTDIIKLLLEQGAMDTKIKINDCDSALNVRFIDIVSTAEIRK
jgi:ankyrin repeat protein